MSAYQHSASVRTIAGLSLALVVISSALKHLEQFEALADRNAQQVFAEMELE